MVPFNEIEVDAKCGLVQKDMSFHANSDEIISLYDDNNSMCCILSAPNSSLSDVSLTKPSMNPINEIEVDAKHGLLQKDMCFNTRSDEIISQNRYKSNKKNYE